MSAAGPSVEDSARTPAPPALVVLVGAPGTGKSFLARGLAARLGARIVSTDALRRAMFPERRYTPAEHAAVYARAHAELRRLLAGGQTVVFDATNLEEPKRRVLYRIAEQSGAGPLIVRAYADAATVRARLLGRLAGTDPQDVSEAGWDVYVRLSQKLDPIPRPHFVVNTGVSLDAALDRIVASLGRR